MAVSAIIAQQHAALSSNRQPQAAVSAPVMPAMVAQQVSPGVDTQQSVAGGQPNAPVPTNVQGTVSPLQTQQQQPQGRASVFPQQDPGTISPADFIMNLQAAATAATAALSAGHYVRTSSDSSMTSSNSSSTGSHTSSSSGYSSASQSSLVLRPTFQSLGGNKNYSFNV